MFKKLLTSFLIAIIAIFFRSSLLDVQAAENAWYDQSFEVWFNKVYDESVSPSNEIFGERYTAGQVQWIMYSVPSVILNLLPGNPEFFTCIMGGSVDTCFDTLPSAIQDVADSLSSDEPTNQNLASTYLNKVANSSISGVGYLKTFSQKISPISNVKAADGIGLNAGKSVLSLWKITRNMSFGLLIVATIVLAFMIMFRVKINPQTVITIQSAIPKLMVAIILITFSYAIAGLLIDLMYLVIGLIALMISSNGLSGLGAADLFDKFISQFDGFGIMYVYWINLVGNAAEAIFTSGKLWWAGIAFLVVAILSILAILWWSPKIIFVMIKNFVMLMITIVIGPLEIMFGTISTKIGFGSWLRRLSSYVAVYPILIIMIFFSFFFLKQGITDAAIKEVKAAPFRVTQNVIGSDTWTPPFGVGVGYQTGSQLIWILVSLFIFSNVTKVCNLTQSLFAGKPFEYGTGIGEAWGTIQKGAGVAYEGSGMKGYVDTIRLARQARRTGSMLEDGKFTRKVAERVVGGQKAGGAIEGAQQKLYKGSGGGGSSSSSSS